MIPVFEPDFGEEEIAAVVAAVRRGEDIGVVRHRNHGLRGGFRRL